MTGSLARHGILHGRELAYDTEINSTKCFVLLLAVMDWAKPKAELLAQRLESERELKFTGSDETDSEGCRLDTRGFKSARKVLDDVVLAQIIHYQNRAQYATKRDLRSGKRGDRFQHPQLHLRLTEDQQEYWAWAVTPSGFVFGVAAQAGNPVEWKYAGKSPPVGPIAADDWRQDDIDPN
jgi:hypothetical protein